MPSNDSLVDREYVRQRLDPQPGDPFYLHLSDLRFALEGFEQPNKHARILDFGCGGSPYRPLFPAATYHRADLPGVPDVDFTLTPDSRVAVADQSYDLILSTQVLEHVADPSSYLAEAYRALRPGGCLLLTTHGTFYDHGCPYDYTRWTADGLKRLVEGAGFRVTDLKKLTAGPRAVMFLLRHYQQSLLSSELSVGGFTLRLFRLPFRLGVAGFERFLDRAFARYRSCPPEAEGTTIYIALYIAASRPGRSVET